MHETNKWTPVEFSNGQYTVYLNCRSRDNITTTGTQDSKDNPLNQPGCLVYNDGLTNSDQVDLYKVLANNGYGPSVCLLPNLAALNVPLYLNGRAIDGDGNPQPYVKYEGTPRAVLNYYKADNTLIGQVIVLGGGNNNRAQALCGTGMFESGKFGTDEVNFAADKTHSYDQVQINQHGSSNYRYDWVRLGGVHVDDTNYYAPFQVFNALVVEDLWEYLPHEPEGFAETDGEGDFDATSDAIGIPGVPGISVLSTGFIRMYLMSQAELLQLSNTLWDTTYDYASNIQKNFQDPMESMINLCMCPVKIDTQYQTPGASIIAGNLDLGLDMNCTGTAISTPYKRIDFGTIYLNEFWGNYADYSPNTRISIFLPYCGVQNLAVNDVMNGGINLWANCDVFTGSIQYFLFSAQTNHRGHGHQSVLYTWTANMKYNMPIMGSDFTRQIVSSIANVAGDVSGGLVSMIGETAKASTSSLGGLTGKMVQGLINPSSLMHQSHVSRGGGWGGIAGALGHQYPYLILERPELTMAENYEHSVGQPYEVTDYLQNHSGGFVKVRSMHIEIPSATSNELNEIEKILSGGVIV